MNTRDKVIDILSEYRSSEKIYKLLEEGDSLTPLALNSIEFIKFTVDLELKFEITWGIEDMYLGKFESFNYLLNYIEERIDRKNEG